MSTPVTLFEEVSTLTEKVKLLPGVLLWDAGVIYIVVAGAAFSLIS